MNKVLKLHLNNKNIANAASHVTSGLPSTPATPYTTSHHMTSLGELDWLYGDYIYLVGTGSIINAILLKPRCCLYHGHFLCDQFTKQIY